MYPLFFFLLQSLKSNCLIKPLGAESSFIPVFFALLYFRNKRYIHICHLCKNDGFTFSQECFADEREKIFETTSWSTYLRYISTNRSLIYVLIFIVIVFAIEVKFCLFFYLKVFFNFVILINCKFLFFHSSGCWMCHWHFSHYWVSVVYVPVHTNSPCGKME